MAQLLQPRAQDQKLSFVGGLSPIRFLSSTRFTFWWTLGVTGVKLFKIIIYLTNCLSVLLFCGVGA